MQESKRSTEIFRVTGKGLGLEGLLKVWEIGQEFNVFLSKSIIIDAITNEFASCSAVRNDTVS